MDHTHSPIFFLFFAFFGLVVMLAVLLPYWFIFKKAGFSPWLALLMVVPLANIVMLYVLAFAPWNVVPVSQVYPAPPAPRPPQV
jgi:hypothetical protein